MLVSIQTKSATFSDWGMMNGQMHRLSLILFWFSRRLQNLSWYFSADIQPAASFPRRGTEQYIGKRNTRSILTKNDVIPPWIDKLMVPYGKELLFTLCGVKILIVPLSRCRWSFTSIPDEWVTHFLSPQAIESVTWENAETQTTIQSLGRNASYATQKYVGGKEVVSIMKRQCLSSNVTC